MLNSRLKKILRYFRLCHVEMLIATAEFFKVDCGEILHCIRSVKYVSISTNQICTWLINECHLSKITVCLLCYFSWCRDVMGV